MDDVHKTLGMYCSQVALSLLTAVLVLIQQLARDINKSRRAYNYLDAISGGDG
jgi:hypothetical protein